MTSLYQQFKSSETLEKSGILLEYGLNSKEKPICIRIARAGGANAVFLKKMEGKLKPHRRSIQTETMDNSLAEKLIREVYAETVVLGWEGVEFPVLDTEGKPTDAFEELPYNRDNCIRLFVDLPDLFKDVQEQSQRAALFRADILAADAGN